MQLFKHLLECFKTIWNLEIIIICVDNGKYLKPDYMKITINIIIPKKLNAKLCNI